MTDEAPPTSGWLCTDLRESWAVHLMRTDGPPIIYREAKDTGLPGIVLRRHCGAATELLVLQSGLPTRLAPGIWLTRSTNSPRGICIHADPEARTSRRWHYTLNPQEISLGSEDCHI